MGLIADNQTTSPGDYLRSIQTQARVPHEFLCKKAARIDQAYLKGEPLWMIINELELIFHLTT